MAHIMNGTVLSAKMQKTAVVSVESKSRHPLYKKVIITHKKYKARYENMEVKEGDRVEIKEVRPISREVRHIVTKKLD